MYFIQLDCSGPKLFLHTVAANVTLSGIDFTSLFFPYFASSHMTAADKPHYGGKETILYGQLVLQLLITMQVHQQKQDMPDQCLNKSI